MIPLYLLSLGLAGSTVGVFVRRILAVFGLVPGFQAGLMLASGAALLFIALQLFYMALLRLFVPSRSASSTLFESLSNASVLILAPYLAGLPVLREAARFAVERVAGPSEKLLGAVDKFEPLLYLGLFVGVHFLFKLLALYAAVRSQPAHRYGTLGWLGSSLFAALVALIMLLTWRADVVKARLAAPSELQVHRVGDAGATAQSVPEGAYIRFPLAEQKGRNLVFRWGTPPDSQPLVTIQAAVQFGKLSTTPEFEEITLAKNAWTEWRIPAERIPEDATDCRVLWTAEKASAWVIRSGLQPASEDRKSMLLSGPFLHESRALSKNPNLVVLLVEGLGAEHVHSLGYERNTTPALDTLAARGLRCPGAFTPAPDTLAATMSIFTGVGPLAHGFLGDHRGPLPDGMRTLPDLLHEASYTTAAFTEGDGPDEQDLICEGASARGFEVVDAYFPVSVVWRRAAEAGANPVVPAGSATTLDKAAQWIDAHKDEKFMVFVRLRELRQPQWLRKRYGDGFVANPDTPRPLDVYDTALADVDKQIGAFFERLREMPGLENTVYLITSPYGFDFSGDWYAPPARRMTESCLRVPAVFLLPDRLAKRPQDLNALVGFEDLGVTLAGLCGVRFPHQAAGINLTVGSATRDLVSLMGQPLVMSLRTADWRFTWQSGLDPFTREKLQEPAPLELFSLDAYYRKWKQGDNLAQRPDVVKNCLERLHNVLNTASTDAQNATPVGQQ